MLAHGEYAWLSPDGARAAVTDYTFKAFQLTRQALTIYPTAGGPGVPVAVSQCALVAWAPNSTEFVCSDRNGLQFVDAATGVVTTLLPGTFGRASFSPDSTRIAFEQAGTIKIIDLATRAVTPLIASGASPVWGPATIAFAATRREGKYNAADVATINPDGSGLRLLTALKPRQQLFAIHPVAWSADGTKLLAGISGLDAWTGREAYGVDAVNGGLHLIAHGVAPAALSRDGRFVYGPTGDPECCGYATSNIARVPWAGGKPKVLVPHSMSVSFNG